MAFDTDFRELSNRHGWFEPRFRIDMMKKLTSPLMTGMLKYLFGSPLLHDDTMFHEHNFVRHITGKTHLMRHHNHGYAAFRQSSYHRQDSTDEFRIQCGCWFVEENDFRIDCNGTRNAHSLLLSAGQLGRIIIIAILHSDLV